MPETRTATSGAIAFHGEAHESAASAYRALEGWTVEVSTAQGDVFTATVGAVRVNEDNGQYVVSAWEWADPFDDESDRTERALDLYDDIARVEVY